MQEQSTDPSELVIGFIPSDPSIIVSQIQKMNLTNKIMGFEAIVNSIDGGAVEELEALVEQEDGLYELIISQLVPANKKIVGLIATCLRRLSAVFQERFLQVMSELPFDFLLSVTDNTEVIDFLEQSAKNFDEFGELLFSLGDSLESAIGTWLQSTEEVTRSTLELLTTLAQFEGAAEHIDFSLVKPLTDPSFSTDIRGLALSVLTIADSENLPDWLDRLVEMFFNEDITGTVILVIHDIYNDARESGEEIFDDEIIPRIYERLGELIELPEAALFLADISERLDEAAREQALAAIFEQSPLAIEQADAIYRICEKCEIALSPEFVAQLTDELINNESGEVLQCAEAMLVNYPDYFATEEGQAKLHDAMQREPEFAVHPFRICITCCMECPIADPLMELVRGFAEQCDMDEDMAEACEGFLSSH